MTNFYKMHEEQSGLAGFRERKRAMSLVGHGDAGRPSHDYYPTTDEGVTHALCDRIQFEGTILEPACGQGHISEVLKRRDLEVLSSDLHDYGYGAWGIDFLEEKYPEGVVQSVVTNPPYSLPPAPGTKKKRDGGMLFALKAFEVVPEGGYVCLFHKVQFICGTTRKEKLFAPYPLYRIFPISWRVSLRRNGDAYKNGGMIDFAWYVWKKGYTGPTITEIV